MINNSYKVGDFIIISEIIKGTEIKVVRNLLDEIRNKRDLLLVSSLLRNR